MVTVRTAKKTDIEPSHDLEISYDDNRPVIGSLSIDAWKEIPAEIRETLGASFIERNGAPSVALISWDAIDANREAIEEAIELAVFDRADTEYQAQRLCEIVEGISPTVPLEVVKAIDGGAAPLTAWRRHRGLRQNELAERTGLDRSYISHLEGGTRQGTPEVLMRIANVLGCRIEDLLPRPR